MINLISTPQRSDFRAEYTVDDDTLIVKIGDVEETFDFTGLEEGTAEEIIAEELPINPIIWAEKVGDTIDIKVIRFYGADEKYLFEGDIDG